MRIALVSEVWLPSINGVVTRLEATVRELLAAGDEVLVIAPRTGPADASVPHRDGLTLVRVPSFRFGFIYGGQPWGSPIARIRDALASFAPDLVHVVSPFVLGIAGVRAARALGLPLVASFHTDIAAYAGSYKLGWSRPVIWRILRGLHNAAAVNLVTSRHSEALLTSHGVRNIRLWRPGVDLELFRPRDRAGHAEAGGADAHPRAIYVGRLADEKRLDALLPLARSGRVALEFVGDGPDRARLEGLFDGTDAVFRGSLVGVELAEAYRGADVFVFTSTTETLGLVIIEALASGLPVVAVESPASRELLGGAEVARLVPAGAPELFESAVDDVLRSTDPDARPAAARARAADWGWAHATDGLRETYLEVVAGSTAGRAPATRPA